MRSLLWIAAALVLTAGCGPSAKDIVEKNRSGLEARVRAIEQFAKKVESGEASAAAMKLCHQPRAPRAQVKTGDVAAGTRIGSGEDWQRKHRRDGPRRRHRAQFARG